MAKAEAMTRAVERVVTEVVPDGVYLRLSQDEAETLAGLLYRIGGPFEGRRRHAGSILEALSKAGVRQANFKTYDPGHSIYIADDE